MQKAPQLFVIGSEELPSMTFTHVDLKFLTTRADVFARNESKRKRIHKRIITYTEDWLGTDFRTSWLDDASLREEMYGLRANEPNEPGEDNGDDSDSDDDWNE